MSLEDPFFVVKDEVCKALSKTRSLFQRWLELHATAEAEAQGRTPTVGGVSLTSPSGGLTAGVLVVGTPVSANEELECTNTELRNSLRSIEWDLEDLEETIGIVEKNPRKFRIDSGELSARRSFIFQTKEEVKCMKNRLASAAKEASTHVDLTQSIELEVEITTNNSPLRQQPSGAKKMPAPAGGSTRYSRLVNQADDSPSHAGGYQQTMLQQQQMVMAQQDEQLDELASSMSVLKQMSQRVGQEVDEQAVMLDDFGHEMDNTQSKMNNTLNKIAKVMHLTNDKRQWAAIGLLSAILVVVILLFFVL